MTDEAKDQVDEPVSADEVRTALNPSREGLPPNPADNVYTVSIGIKPTLPSQEAVDEVAALDPPGDQVPAIDPEPGDTETSDAEADAKRSTPTTRGGAAFKTPEQKRAEKGG